MSITMIVDGKRKIFPINENRMVEDLKALKFSDEEIQELVDSYNRIVQEDEEISKQKTIS